MMTDQSSNDDQDNITEATDEPFDNSKVIVLHKCKYIQYDQSRYYACYNNLSCSDMSDIYFNIREDGLGGCSLDGFECLWASSRACTGVKDAGCYWFQVRVDKAMYVPVAPSDIGQHDIRYSYTILHASYMIMRFMCML